MDTYNLVEQNTSGLTGLWGTTLTQDTTKNQELFLKTTLRELFVYILFLVDICLCKYKCSDLCFNINGYRAEKY